MDVLLFRALSLLGLAILVALAARVCACLIRSAWCWPAPRSPPTARAGLALTHDLIFDVVLPPLLFEAALNLHWRDFKRDLAPIVALSTIGVALCALVVGGAHVWLDGRLNGPGFRGADRRDRPDRRHRAIAGITA